MQRKPFSFDGEHILQVFQFLEYKLTTRIHMRDDIIEDTSYPYICHKCGEIFNEEDDLQKHIKEHERTPPLFINNKNEVKEQSQHEKIIEGSDQWQVGT